MYSSHAHNVTPSKYREYKSMDVWDLGLYIQEEYCPTYNQYLVQGLVGVSYFITVCAFICLFNHLDRSCKIGEYLYLSNSNMRRQRVIS